MIYVLNYQDSAAALKWKEYEQSLPNLFISSSQD
jgi:hypothetical protein